MRHCLVAIGWTAFVIVSACTATVDLDPLGNRQCPAGTKLCNDRCVSLTLPQTGCASTGCVPCTLHNATANCGRNGACAIAACIGSYEDCNHTAEDGCEIDTDHDPLHCGGCDAALCVVPQATPDCAAGHCAIRSCVQGFGDCDSIASNGCETDLTTHPMHCSKCSISCEGGTTCQSGNCM